MWKEKGFFPCSYRLRKAVARKFQLNIGIDVDTRSLRVPHASWLAEPRTVAKGWHNLIIKLSESLIVEVFVAAVIAADLVLTFATFEMTDNMEESLPVFLAAGFFAVILFGDVLLRLAKDGFHFFWRALNWLELVVGSSGIIMFLMEGVGRASCMESCSGAEVQGTSLGRAIRPLIKIVRVLRAMFNITVNRRSPKAMLEQQTVRLLAWVIRIYLYDFFLIPPNNLYVKPAQGVFHLEKAQIRSTAFKGLHLPMTVSCGIVDLVHVEVQALVRQTSSRLRDTFFLESGHSLLIAVENVMIVVGPGHHQEPPAPAWDFESVLCSKRRLIDLLTRRLDKAAKHQVAVAKEHGGSSMAKKLKQRLLLRLEEVLAQGVHVSIRNLEIRYEDPRAELSRGTGITIVGGMRIGSILIRAQRFNAEKSEQEELRAKGSWRTAQGLFEGRNVDRSNLSKGVRLVLTSVRTCAFWNIFDGTTAGNDASKANRYSDKMAEGSGVNIAAFLHEHAHNSLKERVRLALCDSVECRMVGSLGRSQAREFARRLRDRVIEHRYVVMPFSYSVHASVLPPSPESLLSEEGLQPFVPHVDLDLRVDTLNVLPDIAQLKSVWSLIDYMKRWTKEDQRFQWKPPPAARGGASAQARWAYALQRVLFSIDSKGRWNTLSWIDLWRRIRLVSEYTRALTSRHRCDQEYLALLQVGLATDEILRLRKDAAIFRALKEDEKRKEQSVTRLSRLLGDYAHGCFGGRPNDKEEDFDNVFASSNVPVALSVARSNASLDTMVQSRRPRQRRLRQALQVRAYIDVAQLGVLTGLAGGVGVARKPLILSQARRILLSAAHTAPRWTWVFLAPPAVALSLNMEAASPTGVVAELSIDAIRAVFSAAPSSAPQLRRLVACGTDTLQPSAEELSLKLRIANMGVSPSGDDSWEFAMCIPPLKVNICQPLLKELVRTITQPSIFIQPDPMRDELATLKRLLDGRNLALNDRRLAEKLTGIDGILTGGILAGSIVLLGDLQAVVLEPLTGQRWLQKRVQLPSGSLTLSRGGKTPQTNAGFQPFARERGAERGPVRSKGGWWFQTEAEAKAMTEMLERGQLPQLQDDAMLLDDCDLDLMEDPEPEPPSLWDGGGGGGVARSDNSSSHLCLKVSELGLRKPELPLPADSSNAKQAGFMPSACNVIPMCCSNVVRMPAARAAATIQTPLNGHTVAPTASRLAQHSHMDSVQGSTVFPAISVEMDSLHPSDVGLPPPGLATALWEQMGLTQPADGPRHL